MKEKMIKNISIGILISVVALVSKAEDAPTTLLSSGTISPYKAQRNGLFMAADFLAVVPANTTFKLSTQPWMDTSTNTVVISKMPYVSGTKYAKDYAKEGSIFTVTTDDKYRYFRGNGLPNTAMGDFPVFRISIFFASISAHVTAWPNSDSPTPVDRPTYPVPTTAVFIIMMSLEFALIRSRE
jgi:hypothetical protein